MDEYLARFVTYLIAEKNASPYTVKNYRHEIGQFLAFLEDEGIESWEEVDRQVLRRYLTWLQSKGYVRASVARRLSTLRSFGRYLLREGILESNPMTLVSSPKVPQRLPAFLTPQQMAELLAAPDTGTPQGQRDRAILEMLYASGVRVSELVGLNVGQVDLKRGEARVWGKRGKERVVLLGEPACRALQLYVSDGRGKLIGRKTTNALFLNRFGGRLSSRSVGMILDKYAKLAGLECRVSPHILRHTFATHMLDGGADLRVVQELLGHARLATTQIYTHVTQTQARRAYLKAHPLAREEGVKNEYQTGCLAAAIG